MASVEVDAVLGGECQRCQGAGCGVESLASFAVLGGGVPNDGAALREAPVAFHEPLAGGGDDVDEVVEVASGCA